MSISVSILLAGLFGLCGCAKDDGVVLRKVGMARLRGLSSDITYGVWKNDGPEMDSPQMPLVLVMEHGSLNTEYRILKKCILVDKDRFYVGKDLSFTNVTVECRTVRPFVNDGAPIDRGDFGINRLAVIERGDLRFYLCYGNDCNGVPCEFLRLVIPRQEGGNAQQEVTNRFVQAQDRINVLSGANVYDPIATNILDDVKLDKPFLFFPRVTCYDDEGAGVIAGRECRVKMACPSRAYAMEQVLAPVTNAIAVGYGMEMESASGGVDGRDLKFFALSSKNGSRVDVTMRPFQMSLDGWRDYFVFELSVHEQGLLRMNDIRLETSQHDWNKDRLDRMRKRVAIARRRQVEKTPTVIDDWHELSADEIERTRNFTRRSSMSSDCIAMMKSWCSNRLGVVLGADARKTPWLKVEDKATYPRKFRSLLPTVNVSTNGWIITEIHANRRSATIFGVKAARRFPSKESATSDCVETLHEIENMLFSYFIKDGSRKDAAITDEQVRLRSLLFDIAVTLPREVGTNCWEYSMDLVVPRLQSWMHVMTTSGCIAEPE